MVAVLAVPESEVSALALIAIAPSLDSNLPSILTVALLVALITATLVAGIQSVALVVPALTPGVVALIFTVSLAVDEISMSPLEEISALFLILTVAVLSFLAKSTAQSIPRLPKKASAIPLCWTIFK